MRTAAAGRSRSASGSGNNEHNACKLTTTGLPTTVITLAVHPWCGETVTVLRGYGLGKLWVERPNGELRIVPASWTALHPRSEVPVMCGREVRLSTDGVRELARWVRARRVRAGREIDPGPGRGEKTGRQGVLRGEQPRHDHGGSDGEAAPGRGAATAPVVGQAGAPDDGRRGGQNRR
jgi:hypothetical protein